MDISIYDASVEFIDRDEYKEVMRRGMPAIGDVLVTTEAPLGNVAEIDNVDIALAQRVIKYRTNSAMLFQRYLKYYFLSDRFQDILLRNSSGTTAAGIKGSVLHRLPLVLPTYDEQTTIANALSDVDALITSLEKLINKKRAIKTATMQQLLTGKKRLPSFDKHLNGKAKGTQQTELGEIPEDWVSGELGSFVEHCSSGATPYRGNPEFYKGKIRWIRGGELNYDTIEDILEKISEEAVNRTNLKIHPKGTFLIAITGLEAEGTRGSCAIVGRPATTNQSCMAIYPKSSLLTEYLYIYYVYKGKELALKYCQGTKQQSYTARLVKLLPVVLPSSIEEQRAIANVLSDMDQEIDAVQMRIDKTKQIKQGMMQELLTGRTRLV